MTPEAFESRVAGLTRRNVVQALGEAQLRGLETSALLEAEHEHAQDLQKQLDTATARVRELEGERQSAGSEPDAAESNQP